MGNIMNTKTEEEFNTALGHKLMVLRLKEKISQNNLGMRLEISGQQIHKYETGESRMPPEKLFRCAEIFYVPIQYFFNEAYTAAPFDKNIITISAEVHELPRDIRQAVYTLSRVINKSWKQEEEANNDIAEPNNLRKQIS
jgi:transcriptional regulator with XRE-family HTH domain